MMAALTLDSNDRRIARETELSGRIMRWAIIGSVAVHLVALLVFSVVRLAPVAPETEAKLIEVKLLNPASETRPAVMRPEVAPSPAIRPQAEPSARLPMPAAERMPADVHPTTMSPRAHAPVSQPPTPRPQAFARPSLPRPAPAAAGGGGAAIERAAPIAPATSTAHPAAATGGERPTAAPGGGEVGLGSGSRQGDLPGSAGGGGTGSAPGAGGGSGSGYGPGAGGGPPTAGGGGTGHGSGSGVGSGSGSGEGAGGTGGAGHVSRLADRKLPTLLRRTNPVYPVAAQVEGVQGSVRLLVTVTRDGAVGAVKVVASSGDARLDVAAVKAVKQWRYQPAIQDGVPREVDTHASVTFALE